jgi:hypothetical protein
VSDFESWDSYSMFAWTITTERRFVRTPKAEKFIDAVIATSPRRDDWLESGTVARAAHAGHRLYTKPLLPFE